MSLFKLGEKVVFSQDIVEPTSLLSMTILANKGETGEIVHIIKYADHDDQFCVQTDSDEIYVFQHEIEVVE